MSPAAQHRIRWTQWFQVVDPLPELPRPQAIEVKIVSGRTYGLRGDPGGRLRHCQLMVGLRGTGWFERGDRGWPVPPGTGILYDFKDPTFRYRLPDGASEPWEWVRCGFYGADRAVAELVARHPAPFPARRDGELVRRLFAFRPQRGSERRIDAGAGCALVGGVLDDLARAMRGGGRNAGEELADRLESWLRDHAADPAARVGDGARALHVSHEHATRCYVARYRMGPRERLEQLRLRLASQRIAAEDSPLGRIAADLGFSSASHFARRFRRAFGTTPSAWRRAGCPPVG